MNAPLTTEQLLAERKNYGGPAFPVADSHHANGQIQFGSNGMTLRDYFAAKAMQSLVLSKPYYDLFTQNRQSNPSYAIDAYALADAMLAERNK